MCYPFYNWYNRRIGVYSAHVAAFASFVANNLFNKMKKISKVSMGVFLKSDCHTVQCTVHNSNICLNSFLN